MAPVQKRGLRALELWCQRVTAEYPNVKISDLSSSFRDGLAFNAIIHHFRPHLFDYSLLVAENVRYNNEHAFKLAEEALDIPALLDPEDMVESEQPDKFSVATYLAQFYHLFKDETGGNTSLGSISSSPMSNVSSPCRLSSSESDNDSLAHGSGSESTGDTPTTTPIASRHSMMLDKHEIAKKYGEDIFDLSPMPKEEFGEEEKARKSDRSGRNVVSSLSKQFELNAKISAS